METWPSARFPVRSLARLDDCQASAEEKEYGISQRLLPRVKVAVRAAKQDVEVTPLYVWTGRGPDIHWHQSTATIKPPARVIGGG